MASDGYRRGYVSFAHFLLYFTIMAQLKAVIFSREPFCSLDLVGSTGRDFGITPMKMVLTKVIGHVLGNLHGNELFLYL